MNGMEFSPPDFCQDRASVAKLPGVALPSEKAQPVTSVICVRAAGEAQ